MTDSHKILANYISQNKLRNTFEREKVLDYIESYDRHFSVKQLHKGMEKEVHLSLSGIYNIIDLLVKAGLVIKHPFGENECEYESIKRAKTHYHKICHNCGAVKEYSDTKLQKTLNNKLFSAFTIEYQAVYTYGLCKKCYNKLNPKKKKKNESIKQSMD